MVAVASQEDGSGEKKAHEAAAAATLQDASPSCYLGFFPFF